ncbi:MAG: hypothetical protein IJJ78_02145 [Paludibacteraceae bacterium]|nr:hypothetical protein [Paludibacteraceae bacterium]MBQ7748368.1 hypothetical protein [Paludibacteraceae bacterium]MBR0497866.1 hypothetical protein [Paludibacteraceae bacterium]
MIRFGKLENDRLVYAPSVIIDDNKQIISNDASVYLQYGYKEIVPSPCPDDGKEYTLAFEETDTQILYIWRDVENINTIE